MPTLSLEWGAAGVKSAIGRGDTVVIIDVLRFSSTVVTAIARGFVIAPSTDKAGATPGFDLSPYTYLGQVAQRVTIASSNGASLSLGALDAKEVIYGALLNAEAVAGHIDTSGANVSLVAAGEADAVLLPFRQGYEAQMASTNPIFCMEDALGAGAISHFSKMNKSLECTEAQALFEKDQSRLLEALQDTASHRYNESRGKKKDTVYCSKLNLYSAVPSLRIVNGVPEISST